MADETLEFDRAIRLPHYADAGIPEVWMIDAPGRALFMHHLPVGDCYRMVLRIEPSGAVTPATLPEIRVDLTGLFAPA